jgi:hypothetical protein
MVVDIYNTNNRYDLIVADPPWKQSKGGKSLSGKIVVVNRSIILSVLLMKSRSI